MGTGRSASGPVFWRKRQLHATCCAAMLTSSKLGSSPGLNRYGCTLLLLLPLFLENRGGGRLWGSVAAQGPKLQHGTGWSTRARALDVSCMEAHACTPLSQILLKYTDQHTLASPLHCRSMSSLLTDAQAAGSCLCVLLCYHVYRNATCCAHAAQLCRPCVFDWTGV